MKLIKNKNKSKQNKTSQDLRENVPSLQGTRWEMKQWPFQPRVFLGVSGLF